MCKLPCILLSSSKIVVLILSLAMVYLQQRVCWFEHIHSIQIIGYQSPLDEKLVGIVRNGGFRGVCYAFNINCIIKLMLKIQFESTLIKNRLSKRWIAGF